MHVHVLCVSATGADACMCVQAIERGSSTSSHDAVRTSLAAPEIDSLEQAAARVLHELRRKATFEERCAICPSHSSFLFLPTTVRLSSVVSLLHLVFICRMTSVHAKMKELFFTLHHTPRDGSL